MSLASMSARSARRAPLHGSITGVLTRSMAVSILLASCGPSAGSGAAGPSGGQPNLKARYCFRHQGSIDQNASVVVAFRATMGTMAFAASSAPLALGAAADPRACASADIPGPTPGEWTVSATPNGVGAPAACQNVHVPGCVTIDVSADGTQCIPLC